MKQKDSKTIKTENRSGKKKVDLTEDERNRFLK